MDTSDVLKVLKIARATGKCTFRNLKPLSGHILQIAKGVHMIFYDILNKIKKISNRNCLPSVHKHPFISMAAFVLHSVTSICTLSHKCICH